MALRLHPLLLLLPLATLLSAYRTYDDHGIIQLIPQNAVEVHLLQGIKQNLSHKVDFWTAPTSPGKPVTLSLSSEVLPSLQKALAPSNLTIAVLATSMERILKKDLEEHLELKRLRGFYKEIHPVSQFNTSQYHRYSEIAAFMKNLAAEYPSFVQLFPVGRSYEGRPIMGLRIGRGREKKGKGVWVDAGLHAREWAAPAVALVIVQELVKELVAGRGREGQFWYVVPLANPDGYEYTWTQERYWRKTRSRQCGTEEKDDSSCCFGVDPNRNWDYGFGGEGTSDDPCSEIYPGPQAFSEPETKALAAKILELRENLGAYISLHSYSELWLIPFGDKPNHFPHNFDEMLALAKKAERAVEKVRGVHYKVEQSSTLYPASGASDDWAKGVAGIRFSYTIELRPGENEGGDSLRGFALPPDQIQDTAAEILVGLKVVAAEL